MELSSEHRQLPRLLQMHVTKPRLTKPRCPTRTQNERSTCRGPLRHSPVPRPECRGPSRHSPVPMPECRGPLARLCRRDMAIAIVLGLRISARRRHLRFILNPLHSRSRVSARSGLCPSHFELYAFIIASLFKPCIFHGFTLETLHSLTTSHLLETWYFSLL